MAANRILTAFAVLAALLAITVWQFNARETEDRRAPEIKVELPKVKKEDIDELTIAVPNKPTIALKKGSDGKKWDVTEPVKAPADQSNVDSLLGKLNDMEVVAVAATKAENHAKLEVDDAHAVHVTAKQAGKALTDLLIGTYKGGSTMVRTKDSVNVAAVKGSIKYVFDKDLKDWRDRLVSEVTSEQVKTIEFDNPKGKYKFVFEGGVWKQAPGEKILPNFESGKIVSLVGTATTMRAQDFAAPEVSEEAAGLAPKPEGIVRITTSSDAGEGQLVLRVGKKFSENWYLKNEAKDSIYVVSDFSGSRMTSGPDGFQKDAKAEANTKKGPEGSPGNPIPVYPTGMAHHP